MSPISNQMCAFIIGIYHSGSAPKIIKTLTFMIFHPSIAPFFLRKPKGAPRKLELITFTANPSIKSEYFFSSGSN